MATTRRTKTARAKARAAAHSHQQHEPEGTLEVDRGAGRKKLDGDERGKEWKVPAEQMPEGKPSCCGERDPEGQGLSFAGDFGRGKSRSRWILS